MKISFLVILVPWLILYILISRYFLKFKKNLKKESWFIKSGWSYRANWIWPISWQGHLLSFVAIITAYIATPLSFDLNTLALNGPKFLLTFILPMMILYIIARIKSEGGYLVENDKWFNKMGSMFQSSTYINDDGSISEPMSYEQFRRVAITFCSIVLMIGLVALTLAYFIYIQQEGHYSFLTIIQRAVSN